MLPPLGVMLDNVGMTSAVAVNASATLARLPSKYDFFMLVVMRIRNLINFESHRQQSFYAKQKNFWNTPF